MAAAVFPDVGVKSGNWNMGQWASIFSTRFDEGYLSEIQRYGLGSYFMDFLMMADQTTSVTTRTPKVFEKLEWESTVKSSTIIDVATYGGAGVDIVFTIDASDIDASGNVPCAVGEGIVIPAAYQTSGENRIYVITDITALAVVTASPLSQAGATIAASRIAVDVPAGMVFKIHSNYFGYGTGQPPGDYSVRAERTYNTQIIKTSMGYEGGINAIKWKEVKTESGVNSVWLEGQELAESKHSKRIDDAIFLGELNDNALLTQASNFGGTNKRTATKGLWNWAEEAGQELLYPGVWDYTQLYDYKDLIISQNVVARDIMFLYGSDLGRQIEESNLDYIKEYSGGSDLFRTANEIGVNIKYFMGNGFMFMFQELKSFANPLRYGNKNYEFSKYGLMMPDQKERVTVDGKTESHSNIVLGHLNHGGENRQRIIRVLDGMSGRETQAVNGYDGSNLYILSEIVPLVFRPNQLVQVKPQ